MPSALNLALGAVDQARPSILYGQVSSSQPAPTSFNQTLFVVFPQWDANYNWQFSDWPACHGSTFPTQGATVMVARDDQRNLRVVWWDGLTTFAGGGGAASGATGPGGVTGTFTGAAQTIPAPAGTFWLYWGVLNQPLVTITMPRPSPGANFRLRLDQDSVGNRQLMFTGNPAVNDPSGVLNVVSGICQGIVTTAFQTNQIRCESDGIAWFLFPDTAGPPTLVQQSQARSSLGLDLLPSAMAAATTNIATLSGLAAVDSYTPAVGDPLLLTGQTAGAQNGLWLAQAGVWIRDYSYFTGNTFRVRSCMVAGGATNSGWWWSANTTSKTIDTDSTTWVKRV